VRRAAAGPAGARPEARASFGGRRVAGRARETAPRVRQHGVRAASRGAPAARMGAPLARVGDGTTGQGPERAGTRLRVRRAARGPRRPRSPGRPRPRGVLAAARDTGCQAVHPGYGFLSERAPFAEAVTEAGLAFVGPSAAAIRAMGDKTEARRRMQQAGVPIVPGTTRPLADHTQARPEAARLGYPVLLKAVAGGGGKGMRLVQTETELEPAFEMAQSEAQHAFGAGEVDLGE